MLKKKDVSEYLKREIEMKEMGRSLLETSLENPGHSYRSQEEKDQILDDLTSVKKEELCLRALKMSWVMYMNKKEV